VFAVDAGDEQEGRGLGATLSARPARARPALQRQHLPAPLGDPGATELGLTGLREALESAWSVDTTYCLEDYGDHDPAWGQCAVTAVVVQARCGGELRRGWAINRPLGLRTRHYWNHIAGVDIDLTWRQFAVGTTLEAVEEATHSQLVANQWMATRVSRLSDLIP
jgi:hypothetical protein